MMRNALASAVVLEDHGEEISSTRLRSAGNVYTLHKIKKIQPQNLAIKLGLDRKFHKCRNTFFSIS